MVCNTYLRISSFGDSLEFAFFGALTSVGALFVFHRKEKEKNMKSTDFFTNHKNKLIIVGIILLIPLVMIISSFLDTVNNNSTNSNNACAHSYSPESYPAAHCTEAKDVKYVCTYCGDYYWNYGAVPAKGHVWRGMCNSVVKCNLCGTIDESSTNGAHEWIKATCKKAKHCLRCGLEEGNIGSHIWVNATCIEPKHCSFCGLEEGEKKSSHTWVNATCTKPKHCYYCGLEQGEAIDHKYSQGKCTICNKKLENIILPKIPVVTVSGSDLFKITSLSYTMEKYDNNSFYLHLIYSGEKAMGSGYGKIEFKILDSDGYVVYTSYLLTEKLSPGDKIRNVNAKIGGEKFSYNETYTIVITNTYNK